MATEPGYFPALVAVKVPQEGITYHMFALKLDPSQPVKKPVIETAQWQPPVVTQSGSVEDGWQITAKSDKAAYLPGEPVVVTVMLKNVSTRDQTLADTGWDSDFEFVVTRQGTETQKTEYGAQSHQRWADSRKRLHSAGGGWPGLLFGPLHPGQGKVYHLVVNRFQDMTLDGPYTVVVKVRTDTSEQLVADPIVVDVLTPAGAP